MYSAATRLGRNVWPCSRSTPLSSTPLLFVDHLLQLPPGFSLRKLCRYVVLRRYLKQPFSAHLGTSPNEILRCQDELEIHHPLGLRLYHRGRIISINLVAFFHAHGSVRCCSFSVSPRIREFEILLAYISLQYLLYTRFFSFSSYDSSTFLMNLSGVEDIVLMVA